MISINDFTLPTNLLIDFLEVDQVIQTRIDGFGKKKLHKKPRRVCLINGLIASCKDSCVRESIFAQEKAVCKSISR